MKEQYLSKINHSKTTYLEQVNTWKKANEKIVFTNGCFDIIHAGHVQYIYEAAQLGDRLIIAVNDDDSVSRLKGSTRPINILQHRLQVLAGLGAVDMVIPFSEDTPHDCISAIVPDVLVKGGDYKIQEIVGSDIVTSAGGKVIVLSFLEGISTSHMVDKIRKE